jgi:hypothetical protein
VRASQARGNLCVCRLPEIVVELADREEGWRGRHADLLVGVVADPGLPPGGRDRHGQHDPRRAESPGYLARGPGRRAGGYAVVDDYGDPAAERPPLPAAAVAQRAALDLLAFALLGGRELTWRGDGVPYGLRVHHPHTVFADGTERELGLEWRTELAHDDDVQRGAEGVRDLGGNWHPAARQAEHDNVAARQVREPGSQLLASVGAIFEQHGPPSTIPARTAAGEPGHYLGAGASGAAASMNCVTSAGWETIATWLDGISVVTACMRLANWRSAAGGITSSFAAIMYQLG